ncbi:MAG TPA: hypothetical protein VG838_12070 [Opitutaceae bacterium]|nr:hypothetical protein [Opitutaceae bacterium]
MAALVGANVLFGWHLSWVALAGLTALAGTARFFWRQRGRNAGGTPSGSRGWAERLPLDRITPWVPAFVDGCLLGLAVWAIGQMTSRGWGPTAALEAGLAGGIASGTARFLRPFARPAAAVAAALLLGLLGRTWPHPLGWIGATYATAAAALAGALGSVAVRRSGVPETETGWEHLRLLAIMATAAGLFSPLFTPELVGGLDARWYGYAVTDALAQVRAGVFPVLVGQGEYMFNGAVHPFRTAPYHCYLAIVLDLATFHRLTPLAIEHLTLAATALQAGLTSYFVLAAFATKRRTAAALLAMIFLTAPLLAAYVYGQEMYMTAMAFGFLPLVLYGNIRSLERGDFSSLLILAGALSAVWMCHAPVALWATLATLGMQGLRLLTWDWNARAWRHAAAAGAAFLALSLCYFASISELDSSKTQGTALLLATGVVFGAGLVGFVRFVATGSLRWLAASAGAAAILFFSDFIRGVWLGAALVAAGLLGLLPGKKEKPFGRLAVASLAGVLGIGLAAGFATAQYPRWQLVTFAEALAAIGRNFPGNLLPVSPTAIALSDLQLGWSCWLLLGALFFSAWRVRARELQVLSLVAGGFALLTVPVPGFTPALLSLIPQPVYAVSTVLIGLRFLPVFGALALFAGGWALLRILPGERGGRALLVLAVLLAWNLVEIRKFVARGRAALALPQTTAAYLRPENARLYSYDYDNFPLPTYVVNGVVDYHLESRLLRPDDQAVLPDPIWQQAPRFVSVLTGSADRYDPRWLHLSPKVTLAPGERLALEFKFENRDYHGTLVFRGSRGFYRDYLMPNAGDGEKSFGVDPRRPKMLAVWNSTAQPEEVELLFLREAPEAVDGTGATFATITGHPYQPENLQVKITGLVPYRAEVATDRPVLLETPRVFIPGYRARVNGEPVDVRKSAEKLASIPLPAGRSVVELTNGGSARLKFACGISLAAWLGLAFVGLRAGWRGRREA